MIRCASTSDAESIAVVHVRSRQAIYRGQMSDGYLEGLSVDRRAKYWANMISENPEGVAVFEIPAGIVGFVSIEPSRDTDAERRTGELTAIYLDPANWRQGVGRNLINWSKESARLRHWRKMTLWVLKENVQARSFYEALHWRLDGKIKSERFGGVDLTEVRYEWLSDA